MSHSNPTSLVKAPHVSRRVSRALLLCAFSSLATLQSFAQTHWDTDGVTTGLQPGSGVWDTATANWNNSTGTGSLTTYAGGIATFLGNGTYTIGVAGTVNVGGNVTFGNSTFQGNYTLGNGSVSTLSGNGSFQTLSLTGSGANRTLTIASGLTVSRSGGTLGLTLAGGTSDTNQGVYNINGTLQNTVTGFSINGARVNVNTGGTFSSLGTVGVGGATVNGSIFNVNGGSATTSGNFVLSNISNVNAGSASRTNSLIVDSGSLSIAGELQAASTGNTVLGNSTTTVNATVTLTSNITLNGGTTTVGRILEGARTFSGNGTATLSHTSNLTLNGGTLKANRTEANFIDSSLDTAVINSGGAKIDSNGFDIGVSKGMSGVGSLEKLGNGTLTYSAAQSYTGDTIVSVGTLTTGGSNYISDTSRLVLNGGTYAQSAGFTETFASLDLNANSSITLGSSTSQLLFGVSSGEDWGSNTLTITGTNNFVEGFSIRFGTNASGLTGGQLALITINGASGWALDANGYIVSAVPEPSTAAVLAGLGVLGFVACRRRRRS